MKLKKKFFNILNAFLAFIFLINFKNIFQTFNDRYMIYILYKFQPNVYHTESYWLIFIFNIFISLIPKYNWSNIEYNVGI